MPDDNETLQSVAGHMANTENREMTEADTDYPLPGETRKEEDAIARDPELRDQDSLTYEQVLDTGGETPSGKRVPDDQGSVAPPARPGAH